MCLEEPNFIYYCPYCAWASECLSLVCMVWPPSQPAWLTCASFISLTREACGRRGTSYSDMTHPLSGHVPRGPSSTPLSSGPSSNVSESSTCSSGHSPNFPVFKCDPGLALLLPLVSKCSKDLPNPPPPTSPWNCDFLTFLSTLGCFQELLHFRTSEHSEHFDNCLQNT